MEQTVRCFVSRLLHILQNSINLIVPFQDCNGIVVTVTPINFKRIYLLNLFLLITSLRLKMVIAVVVFILFLLVIVKVSSNLIL